MDDAEAAWADLREFRWAHPNAPLLKVALSPSSVTALGHAVRPLHGARMHVSAAGNVAFVSLAGTTQAGDLDRHLRELGLAGITLRGDSPLWLGVRARPEISAAVKKALDPENRFPSLDD